MYMLKKKAHSFHRCIFAGLYPEHCYCVRTYCVHVCLFVSCLLYNLQRNVFGRRCGWRDALLHHTDGQTALPSPSNFSIGCRWRKLFLMVAAVSMGFCRLASRSESQRVSVLCPSAHTLQQCYLLNIPNRPLHPPPGIAHFSQNISGVQSLFAPFFLCPHWTHYTIKSVLCKLVCGADQCALLLNLQLGAVFTRTQQCLEPVYFAQIRLVWMVSYVFQLRDSVVHIREHSDICKTTN